MKSTKTSIRRSAQAFFYSRYICSDCRRIKPKRSLTVNCDPHGSSIKPRKVLQNASISSIAKKIRETGELPSLPTESIIELPRLQRQRKLRDENIVRDDIQATLEAHYAANVLAHGNIHIKLDDSSKSKPRRLAVTPPKKIDTTQNIPQPIVSGGNGGDSFIFRSISLDEKGQQSISQAETRKRKTRNNKDLVVTSKLRHKLLQVDQSLDSLRRLDVEIRIFQQWIELTEDEHDAAFEMWSRFQSAMLENFPEYKFELHGSRTTGLARPFSDIDIKMVIPALEEKGSGSGRGPSPGRAQIKEKYLQAFKRIRNWTRKDCTIGLIATVMRPSRIPLLEIQHRQQQHFNIELSGAVGKPIECKTEFVKYFLNEYPQIKPLFFLIRWWLEKSDIGDSTNGGVSSYLTFGMILTSITHSKQSFDSGELGQQLLQFLRFWKKADWKNLGFAPDPARTFPKFAVNIVAENCSDDTQVAEDEAYQALFTNKAPHRDSLAEWDLQETQTVATSLLLNVSESNDTQTYPLNRLAMEARDSAISTNGGLESDVYLDGIKFLTRQANQLSRVASFRQRYFLLQDPADPRVNVGRSFTKFPELHRLMQEALDRLEKNMQSWDERDLSFKKFQPRKFILEDLIYVESSYNQNNLHPDLALQRFERRRRNFAISMAKIINQNLPNQTLTISEN